MAITFTGLRKDRRGKSETDFPIADFPSLGAVTKVPRHKTWGTRLEKPTQASLSGPPIRLSFVAALFGDGSAGDAVAGIARRIADHVVCFGVDDQRGAAIGEQR